MRKPASFSVRGDLWVYADTDLASIDLTGFELEAADGPIGTVEEAGRDDAASWLLVDTGHWIFGKLVVLPAGIVESVDTAAGAVYIERTKDEIENAPAYDPDRGVDEEYRSSLARYYLRSPVNPIHHDWRKG